MRRRNSLLVTTLLSAALPLGAAEARTICDASDALTVLGVDTAAGQTLLTLTPRTQAPDSPAASVIELDALAERPRAYVDRPDGRLGGSVGPGPVLAVQPCPRPGGSCLQPVRWSEGAFRPLGEPIVTPAGATAAATYDAKGTPWIVLLAPAPKGASGATSESTDLKAWAWSFDGDWREQGSQIVSAVGDLPAAPAPGASGGIVVGTGRFGAGPATTWARGVPALPADRRGQLLALSEVDAAYLSADGVVYGSADAGATWKRSTWTPWGQGTTGSWRQGTDYWIDLPLGERRGSLQLAWFDRRVPDQERLVLTRREANGDWTPLIEAPSAIRTKSGERLAVSHVILPQAGKWLLLSGCVATKEGSGLVVRTFDGRKLSEPKFVAIEGPETK